MPDVTKGPGRLVLAGGEECLDFRMPGIAGIAMAHLQVNIQGMFCLGRAGMVCPGEDVCHYRQLEPCGAIVEVFQQCLHGSAVYATA